MCNRECVYQKLSDDLEWVCPGEAICRERCKAGFMPAQDKNVDPNEPLPVRGKSYAYVDRCDGKGWVKVEEDKL